jgi:hypothetical protein
MRRSTHARRGRRPQAHPALDPLEPRCLLSSLAPFAVFRGRVVGPAGDTITARVDPADFGLALGGRVVLRFDARAGSDGLLDPGPTDLDAKRPGGVRILARRGDVPGGTASVTLASVRPGSLMIRPTPEGGTEGDYVLGIALAGDADGNYRVDRRDLRLIRGDLGRPADGSSSDVNGDGWVGLLDLLIALRNVGASTDVRPLDVSLGVDPADDPDGDGRVDDADVDVVGRTAAGATVRLDLGDDGSFEIATTADADGRYRVTVPLEIGANPIAIETADTFGQVARARTAITRGAAALPVSASFDFSRGDEGWQAGFADLPTNPNETYQLEAGVRPLPPELGVGGTGYLLQSDNHSDDIFMFLKRRLGSDDGVVPNQAYEVRFTIRFASNAPTGAIGAGGAPGESVLLKAGAAAVEPVAVPQDDGNARMNVDVGGNSQSGPAASIVSNIANGLEGISVPYVSLTREHTHTSTVRADAERNLWLLVGTDSGFEGLTALYYQQIEVGLTPVPA